MKKDSPPTDGGRRHVLGTLGSLGLFALGGCGGGGTDTSTLAPIMTSGVSTAATTATTAATTSTAADTTTTSSACLVVPEETAGPYPADGSNASNNNYNVLALSGIVRSDIRTNVGGTAQVGGAPLTLTITLTNTKTSCAPLAGYAIYLWHCTREGTYSVYTTQSLSDNHLRGVQETDANGTVSFITVVPGCYAGRMPHMHLEIYPSLSNAKSAGRKVKTTQLAFPTETLRAIYNNAAGYSQSVANLNATSFATDNVFSDGTSLEMVNFSGDATSGYSANIAIAISA
ncbi:intradiol ring-cleavage dioxygenase [Variovorax sp. J22R115]|uniref:dioxygenase family protein n=1 Tax=Variovorax sp. J22R115 TaxID=3053509 RepID=UPI002578380C|nr:intradiol ring-cleavage dioxygenase [Variovorax sp. J22R115]MDM0049002.1 intradiol ring-cleavage dioxygenase [Variovorax sp. J22R115]